MGWWRKLQYTMGWKLPKHSSKRVYLCVFRCPWCLNYRVESPDLDEINKIASEHYRLAHYGEMPKEN